MSDEQPLVCKVPDCDRTRAATSPDFCLSHEYEARSDAEKVVAEADIWAHFGADFERWCESNGQPHPHHEN